MREKRFALIIANDTYNDESLRELQAPKLDANALAKVLGDPETCNFLVQILVNRRAHRVKQVIEAFFNDRGRDDLLLLYFSGHGVKDEDGKLYFATPDTKRNRLMSTAVSASFINDLMRRTRSRRQVLLLDCCFSGAFAKGMIAKSGSAVGSSIGTSDYFQGRGRVVLTASDAMQYAFEEDELVEEGAVKSIFTSAIVDGIESWKADHDKDNRISIIELYDYVDSYVHERTPNQRPSMWSFETQGEIIIAEREYIPEVEEEEVLEFVAEVVADVVPEEAPEEVPEIVSEEGPEDIKPSVDLEPPSKLVRAFSLKQSIALLVVIGSIIGVAYWQGLFSSTALSVDDFFANPSVIARGENFSLSWSVSNADRVSIDQGIGIVELTGFKLVSLDKTTNFTLTAKSGDRSTDASVQVVVYELIIDAEHYMIGEIVTVTVADMNENDDPMAIEEVIVGATSDTDTVGDPLITLTETGFNTGVFTGSSTLIGAPPADREANELVVNDGDTIAVSYLASIAEALVSAATGILSIDTTPVKGAVSIDGESWGTAPVSQVLVVGPHTVSYGNVSGYTVPPPEVVTVTTGTTTTIGTYTPIATGGGVSIDYVSKNTVEYGDVLMVFGSGVTAGSTVHVYWDFVTAANLLNSTTGLPSGDFESTVNVPSAIYGDHYIFAKDMSTGISTRSGLISVVSTITLTPSSGLDGDVIIVKGYGFAEDSDIALTFGGLADAYDDETDDLGYFSHAFEVDQTTDGEYTVTATDDDANEDVAIFTVGAALILDKTVGPAGTIVKVDGRGFTPSTIIRTERNITLNGTVPVSTRDSENYTATSTGTFTIYIVIPSVSVGDYEIEIDDGAGKHATAAFEINGETSITVTPAYGTPGTVLTVKGYNFTRISGTDVDLNLMNQEAEATTDSSGSFIATIVIPPLDFGTRYDLTANDTRLCNAEAEVLVALIVLQLSDYSAPVGSRVTLMGSGFSAGGDWNATFGDVDLIDYQSIGAGMTYFSYDFYVPSVPPGTYTIGVLDITEGITVGIDFTVTD